VSQPDYQTVFEIGLRSFPWGGMLHPLIFVVIGALLVRFYRGPRKELCQIFGGAGAIFGALIFVIAALVFVPEFVERWRAYARGDSSVVEGIVEDFHPAPDLGAAKESFSVHGIPFSYNVLADTPCFHNAPPHKGPVRRGVHLRIYYKDTCIQRVDVLSAADHPKP
jgi:hypothetical protein